jgi:hypothetical protein
MLRQNCGIGGRLGVFGRGPVANLVRSPVLKLLYGEARVSSSKGSPVKGLLCRVSHDVVRQIVLGDSGLWCRREGGCGDHH